MDDLISRKAAIDRIEKQRIGLRPDIYSQDKIGDAAYRICAEAISRIPTAEPGREIGHWIFDGEGMLHCSACAEIPVNRIRDAFKVVYDIHPLKMNYCPNCGVRMVGESE